MRKTIHILLSFVLAVSASSCDNWLDLKPNNEQVVSDYWQSKEDVEAALMSSYSYLRNAVPTLIKWGELRGGSLYATSSNEAKLQDFNMTESHSLCNYKTLYQAINLANSVIAYAPGVGKIDNTYYKSIMQSHLSEAYFLRSYCYLVLVKNFREVPVVLEPYMTDQASIDLAKSPEKDILAQIKLDVTTALATGAAKGTYSENWQTKGRATKWALYALMCDACLWDEDYATCIQYADSILTATDAFRPVFMSRSEDWYSIFYPGNSNESIFELNWDYTLGQEENNFTSLCAQTTSSGLRFTERLVQLMKEENLYLKQHGVTEEGRMGRMLMSTFVPSSGNVASWQATSELCLWKYSGNDIVNIEGGKRDHNDANFILYRMAEILLMKAQAHTMRGEFTEAIALINRIRTRALLETYQNDSPDELSVLTEILSQKDMEFVGEAKRWYDLLWLGRIQDFKYEKEMAAMVLEGNKTTNPSWIRSVLIDHNAWYLPLPYHDITANKLLVQNPYYSSTK